MTTDVRDCISPDSHATGLVRGQLDPLRYDGQSDDPIEVAGILHTLMPESARVLDVGCGTGSVTRIVNKGKNNQVLAIEPDTHRSAVARDRGIEVVCGFLDQDFLAQNGPFDVVMFSDMLEHLASPVNMLRLATSGLKQGGFVLASVPNVAHWSIRLNLLLGRFNYTETGICDGESQTAIKAACTPGFLAKSITCSGQIIAIDQSLPNSSRTTIYRS